MYIQIDEKNCKFRFFLYITRKESFFVFIIACYLTLKCITCIEFNHLRISRGFQNGDDILGHTVFNNLQPT